jgi:hypothetical protein
VEHATGLLPFDGEINLLERAVAPEFLAGNLVEEVLVVGDVRRALGSRRNMYQFMFEPNQPICDLGVHAGIRAHP